MRIKNKKYIIWIISVLVLASSISIFVPFISNNVSKHSKNYLLAFTKKYRSIKSPNNDIQTSLTLISRLSLIVHYITSSVIANENKLKYLILGTDNNDLKHKPSKLDTFNKLTSIIGITWYSKEAVANINNSIKKLQYEDKKINSIISVIKIHPYTYQTYLNNDGIIIPNIDFFINEEKSITILKTNRISNNLYAIGNSNPSINNVSLSTEEATFGAKAISKSVMSLGKAIFRNIIFSTNIITFNTKLNEYQFFRTVTTKGKYYSVKTRISRNNLAKTNNSVFAKPVHSQLNNLSNLSPYRIILAKSISKYYYLLTDCDNVSGNNYSSNNISVHNNIFKFKNRNLSYSLLIICPLIFIPLLIHFSIGITLVIIDIKKNGIKIRRNNTIRESIELEIISDSIINDSMSSRIKKTLNDKSQLEGRINILEQHESLLNKETDIDKCIQDLGEMMHDLAEINILVWNDEEYKIDSFMKLSTTLYKEQDKLISRLLKINIKAALERVEIRKQEVKINAESLSNYGKTNDAFVKSETHVTLDKMTSALLVYGNYSIAGSIPSQREVELQKLYDEIDEWFYRITLFRNNFFANKQELLVLNNAAYREKKEVFLNAVMVFAKKISSDSWDPVEEMDKDTKILSGREHYLTMYLWDSSHVMKIKEDKMIARFSCYGDNEQIEWFKPLLKRIREV